MQRWQRCCQDWALWELWEQPLPLLQLSPTAGDAKSPWGTAWARGRTMAGWPLTITVVARLEGGGGLQAAPQGAVATVAVVQASIDVDRVLGVR